MQLKNNYPNKKVSYLAVILSLINIAIYVYLAFDTYTLSLKQIMLVIGAITSLYAISTISFAGLKTSLASEDLTIAHRSGLISLVALMFVSFQVLSNQIVPHLGILSVVVFGNVFCMTVIVMKIFSRRANGYTGNEFLKNTQKHLLNISKFSVLCMVVSAVFSVINQFDLAHIVLSLVFALPLLVTNYLKQTKTKSVYHVVLISVLSVLLIYIGLVVFSNGVTPIDFSFYFINALSLLVFNGISIQLNKTA